MPKIVILVCLILVIILALVISRLESPAVKQRCLDFILEIEPAHGQRIFDSICKYRRGFPIAWLTALIWGESLFDPQAIGSDNDRGLGQLTESALLEIERVYGIDVDRLRIFEIEYNLMLTGLFVECCKFAGESYGLGKYQPLYWTILTYKNWLTWDSRTHTKAQRTWDKYQELKHGGYTNAYESEEL